MYLSVDYQDTGSGWLPYSMENEKMPVLAGGRAYRWEGEEGWLLLQELKNEHYNIQLVHCFLNERKELFLPFSGNNIFLLMALESKLAFALGTKKGCLKASQCMLADLVGRHCSVMPEKSKPVGFMAIDYAQDMIEPLTSYFPSLAKKGDGDAPRVMQQVWNSREMIGVLDDLLLCQFAENLRSFFFDNRVRDLLFLLLAKLPNKLKEKGKLSEEEKEKIYKARQLILQDITQHFSIRELARKVELNELKLKIGFKETLGMGPFTLLKNERLKKAHQLLEETDKPIKEIAGIAGYESPTSFLNSFKKHFGYNTKEVKKIKGN